MGSYQIEKGLMKEGSLSARIYFLLLKKQISQTELSRIIYGKEKAQLSNINKILGLLVHKGYVKEVLLSNVEKESLGIDTRAKPYKSTYKPLLEYIEQKVKERKQSSDSSKKEYLTEEDKKVLELIFNSKWFQIFYTEEFLETQRGEVKSFNGEIYSDCPIRFFALFLEELFALSWLFSKRYPLYSKGEEIIKIGNFDKYLEENKNKLNNKIIKDIEKITKRAINFLGYEPNSLRKNKYGNYFKDFAILFIPRDLSEKLSSIGRVPLTIVIHFRNEIERI